MTEERFWDTENEITAAKYTLRDGAMNMRDASRIFRLDPAPPKPENINDYIVRAVQENDMTYFLYFLHHYEPRLNRKVYRFFLNEGFFQYDPVRFLDYKLSCVLALLECLQNYDPSKGAEFLTFATTSSTTHSSIAAVMRKLDRSALWMSTRPLAASLGCATTPVRTTTRSLRNMLSSRTVLRRLLESI